MPKPEKNERLDRHSGTGNRGFAKKDGHAGKFGWGKAGTGEDGEAVIDEKDPNYSSEEDEKKVVLSRVDLVSPSEVIVQEYLVSGDTDEAAKSLSELHSPEMHYQFVKKALYIALDKQAYERELISKLLSSVYGHVLTSSQIADGFDYALDSLEEASLDVPDATEVVAKFIARAIVDDVVPPVFLKNAKSKASNAKAEEAITIATALSTENHGGERLAHIWGPGDLRSVKRLKKEVILILEEFATTQDCAEAERCIRKLNCPSFHFQVVKQAIRLALEKQQESKKILTLLKDFSKSGLISTDHMSRGFKCCYDTMDDIKLDVPHADQFLFELTETAKKEGWLLNDFTVKTSV